mgnify:CR=1 FL=1
MTLFPYTTLFRSDRTDRATRDKNRVAVATAVNRVDAGAAADANQVRTGVRRSEGDGRSTRDVDGVVATTGGDRSDLTTGDREEISGVIATAKGQRDTTTRNVDRVAARRPIQRADRASTLKNDKYGD